MTMLPRALPFSCICFGLTAFFGPVATRNDFEFLATLPQILPCRSFCRIPYHSTHAPSLCSTRSEARSASYVLVHPTPHYGVITVLYCRYCNLVIKMLACMNAGPTPLCRDVEHELSVLQAGPSFRGRRPDSLYSVRSTGILDSVRQRVPRARFDTIWALMMV